MAAPSRKALLCSQPTPKFTGIDFVQVADPALQNVLNVFFVIDPDRTVPKLATAAALSNPSNGAPNVEVELHALSGEAAPDIELKNWALVTVGGITRACLQLVVSAPGGFEPYRLTIRHLAADPADRQLDPFLSSVVFDFKQACETGFDCRDEGVCAPDPTVDFPVDYLARDFESFRRALLDFAAQRWPEWREPIEADFATMMLEIMASLGDDFSWQQDRHDFEARFGSATQRASLFHHARLVDYFPDRGAAAHGPVRLVAKGFGVVPQDTLLWAVGANSDAVPFTLDAAVWVHPNWNDLPYHAADPEQTCIARGARSLLVVAPPASSDDTTDDPDNPGSNLSRPEFLRGRAAIVLSDPADAAEGKKAWPVTVGEVEELTDPLLSTGGVPTALLRIGFAEGEAVPFDLPVDGLSLALNVGTVTAGQAVTEYGRTGTDAEFRAFNAGMEELAISRYLAFPRVIEREGPLDHTTALRSTIARIGLAATEGTSLRFPRDGSDPVSAEVLDLPLAYALPLPPDDDDLIALAPGPHTALPYFDDLLTTDLDSESFTVEPGMWRTVRTFQRMGGDFAFGDYAGDRGWSAKFGFGEFGRPPATGHVLRIRYHTDPGVAGNVSSFALALSVFNGPDADPAAALLDEATNPIAFNNARAEEDPRTLRRNAPQAWRADPRRAVRPEDYSEIIEKLPWVQRAHSVTRWTGSWPTDFVAADPLQSIAPTGEQRRELAREIDCIRLATRDARPVDPKYRDIDIEVTVCIAGGFDESRVVRAVIRALAPPGFFAPDNFTFGQSLHRSALESAVQSIAGVAHVEAIRIRVLDGRDPGRGEWRDFSESRLEAAPDEIIRLQNDPDRSTLGLLTVNAKGVLA